MIGDFLGPHAKDIFFVLGFGKYYDCAFRHGSITSIHKSFTSTLGLFLFIMCHSFVMKCHPVFICSISVVKLTFVQLQLV